jgi:hypothetical protein
MNRIPMIWVVLKITECLLHPLQGLPLMVAGMITSQITYYENATDSDSGPGK